jgi:hypothetical protein
MTPKAALDIAEAELDDKEKLISLRETLVITWTKNAGCYMELSPGSKADAIKMLEALKHQT